MLIEEGILELLPLGKGGREINLRERQRRATPLKRRAGMIGTKEGGGKREFGTADGEKKGGKPKLSAESK